MMRNFEERRTEVFRRSEERIRKRRRIQKQLLVGIPLVCIVLGMTMFLPRLLPMGGASSDSAAAADVAFENQCAEAAYDDAAPMDDVAEAQPAEGEVSTMEGAGQEVGAEEKSTSSDMSPTDWTAPDLGLRLIVESLDTAEGTLYVQWKNDSDWTVTYGEGFAIERLTEDGWVSCALRELDSVAVAYELQPWESRSQSYDLTWIDISQPGTYRIVAWCQINSDGEMAEDYLTAEFEV